MNFIFWIFPNSISFYKLNREMEAVAEMTKNSTKDSSSSIDALVSFKYFVIILTLTCVGANVYQIYTIYNNLNANDHSFWDNNKFEFQPAELLFIILFALATWFGWKTDISSNYSHSGSGKNIEMRISSDSVELPPQRTYTTTKIITPTDHV